jgi:biopolymer transport protein ExbD
MKKKDVAMFDTMGVEGILDVILGCTLIFMLMTALARIEASNFKETSLPDVDLSKTNSSAKGSTAVSKNIISMKMRNGMPEIHLDQRMIDFDSLRQELGRIGSAGHVALRRDKDMPCGFEDKVIAECQNAGIARVSIIVLAAEEK